MNEQSHRNRVVQTAARKNRDRVVGALLVFGPLLVCLALDNGVDAHSSSVGVAAISRVAPASQTPRQKDRHSEAKRKSRVIRSNKYTMVLSPPR